MYKYLYIVYVVHCIDIPLSSTLLCPLPLLPPPLLLPPAYIQAIMAMQQEVQHVVMGAIQDVSVERLICYACCIVLI